MYIYVWLCVYVCTYILNGIAVHESWYSHQEPWKYWLMKMPVSVMETLHLSSWLKDTVVSLTMWVIIIAWMTFRYWKRLTFLKTSRSLYMEHVGIERELKLVAFPLRTICHSTEGVIASSQERKVYQLS